MTDEEGRGVANNIIHNVFKRLNIHYTWEDDCRQEIITKWLESDYNLSRPRQEIMAYATRAALLAVNDWRRRVLVVTFKNRRQYPEPRSLSTEELYGDSLERFTEATYNPHEDPLMFASGDIDDSHDPVAFLDTLSLNKIKLPPLSKNSKITKRGYRKLLKDLARGKTMDEVAADLGVSRRTVVRYVKRLGELNKITSRRESRKTLGFHSTNT